MVSNFPQEKNFMIKHLKIIFSFSESPKTYLLDIFYMNAYFVENHIEFRRYIVSQIYVIFQNHQVNYNFDFF